MYSKGIVNTTDSISDELQLLPSTSPFLPYLKPTKYTMRVTWVKITLLDYYYKWRFIVVQSFVTLRLVSPMYTSVAMIACIPCWLLPSIESDVNETVNLVFSVLSRRKKAMKSTIIKANRANSRLLNRFKSQRHPTNKQQQLHATDVILTLLNIKKSRK